MCLYNGCHLLWQMKPCEACSCNAIIYLIVFILLIKLYKLDLSMVLAIILESQLRA